MTIEELRKQFMQYGLSQNDLMANPLDQFSNWYRQVIESDTYEPGAFSLATVDENGKPWQRIVLLKSYDDDGFVFFTNYKSRKGEQISVNPDVSALFPWHPFARQVVINGPVTKISTAESLKYFSTRPRGSQLGAWASKQSQRIESRSILESSVETKKQEFADKFIPLPPFWGGYRLKPESYEFWQGRDSRLHDRFIYTIDKDGSWRHDRMAP
jgi:pyridoxamine 5'-phosphate oxidase